MHKRHTNGTSTRVSSWSGGVRDARFLVIRKAGLAFLMPNRPLSPCVRLETMHAGQVFKTVEKRSLANMSVTFYLSEWQFLGIWDAQACMGPAYEAIVHKFDAL